MFLSLAACFLLWQNVFTLWRSCSLSWLLACFQVMSLSKDDNTLTGLRRMLPGGRTCKGEHLWDGVLLCYLPNILPVVSGMGSCQQVIVGTGQTASPAQPGCCHIYMRWEIGRMTGEVIKTGKTSLLSLSLNMNHAANLHMWMCRHMWFSREEAFACCLTLWLSLFWQQPLKCRRRSMDNGLSLSGTAFPTLSAIPSDSHSCCRLHYTSLLFQPKGDAGKLPAITECVSVCVCVYMCVCVRVFVWERRKHLLAKSYAY